LASLISRKFMFQNAVVFVPPGVSARFEEVHIFGARDP